MENSNLALSRMVSFVIGIVFLVIMQVNGILSLADNCFIGITFAVLIFTIGVRWAIGLTMLASFFLLLGHYCPLVSLHSEIDFSLMNGVQSAIGRGINILLNTGIYLLFVIISILAVCFLLILGDNLRYRRFRRQ